MRYGISLAFALVILSCTHAGEARAFLKIQTENHLAETKGKATANPAGLVEMEAYSYPSLLKYYTDEELLGVLRFTCDENAKSVRAHRRDESEVNLEWNFTATGKGPAGTSVHGVPRFGATLTEIEPGNFRISCGERVY